MVAEDSDTIRLLIKVQGQGAGGKVPCRNASASEIRRKTVGEAGRGSASVLSAEMTASRSEKEQEESDQQRERCPNTNAGLHERRSSIS